MTTENNVNVVAAVRREYKRLFGFKPAFSSVESWQRRIEVALKQPVKVSSPPESTMAEALQQAGLAPGV